MIWLLLSGRQRVPRLRVLFLCDALDAEQVVLDSPYLKGDVAHPFPERQQPWLWPPSIQLFRPGEVRARWQVNRKSGWRTISEQRLLLEEWGYVAGDSGLMKGA